MGLSCSKKIEDIHTEELVKELEETLEVIRERERKGQPEPRSETERLLREIQEEGKYSSIVKRVLEQLKNNPDQKTVRKAKNITGFEKGKAELMTTFEETAMEEITQALEKEFGKAVYKVDINYTRYPVNEYVVYVPRALLLLDEQRDYSELIGLLESWYSKNLLEFPQDTLELQKELTMQGFDRERIVEISKKQAKKKAEESKCMLFKIITEQPEDTEWICEEITHENWNDLNWNQQNINIKDKIRQMLHPVFVCRIDKNEMYAFTSKWDINDLLWFLKQRYHWLRFKVINE